MLRTKISTLIRTAAVTAATVLASAALAQNTIRVPSADELRGMMREPIGSPCDKCGTVVRAESRRLNSDATAHAYNVPRDQLPPADIGTDTGLTPVLGARKAASDLRESQRSHGRLVQVLTVRFDDGSHSIIEQELTATPWRSGDRVRMVGDTLEAVGR